MDVVYDAIVGAVALKQIKRTSFSPGAQLQADRMSGAVDPAVFFLQGAEPRATFESMDMPGVIAGISATAGLFVSAGTLTIPFNRRANGGTFAGGSTNFTLTGANGMAILQSLGAAQSDEGAVASIELCFLSTDGLTIPVAANVNQALAAEAYDASHAFGPAYLNGVKLTQVVSTRVNTGVALTVKRYDGSVYPTIAFIQTRNPSIEITFENFDAINTYGPLFAAPTACAVYYRQKSPGGTFATDITATHVKASFGAGGMSAVQSAEASGNANGTATLHVVGTALALTAASTIP